MTQDLVSADTLIFSATLLAAFSGVPLLFPTLLNAATGQLIAVCLMLGSSALGVTGSVMVLATGERSLYELAWHSPFGHMEIGVDPLSAWFLFPIFLITGCAALYSRSYWHADSHQGSVRKMTFFFGFMVAGMSAVTLARDGISFIFAWEAMALGAYFLISTEDEKPEVNAAGILYMITTHTATLSLFALFPLLSLLVGSFLFPAPGSIDASLVLSTPLFLLALFAFGMKAGIMPLHIWLPSAHASAPSHISAAMSGVILKIGVYGLLRILSFFTEIPLWWGGALLAIGIISAVAGVAFAIGQHDIKRLLAYHSIENIGIIFMGLGIAFIGVATDSAPMILLGIAGALLHVLNHALFKALLFLGAGSVIHATGTREIDLMGGVGRRLPYTALLFGIGSMAICGLPPLNGFVSELFIYLGFFGAIQQNGVGVIAALAAPALALVGGLAVACFVKVYGIIFMGAPRCDRHSARAESGWQMLLPMLLLAVICVVIGLVPVLSVDALELAALSAIPGLSDSGLPHLREIVPFSMVSFFGFGLVLLLALLAWWYRRRLFAAVCREEPTWGCGYQRPTASMQYTASSFTAMLVNLFSFILKPELHRRGIISGLFPERASFSRHIPETVLERIYIPALNRIYERFAGLRRLQGGVLQQYVLYILITLVVLLAAT